MQNSRSLRSKALPKAAVRPGASRDELIETAARHFAEKGFSKTTIQDIAEDMGMMKGSLYYYIDTKEDLLFEVIQSTMISWRILVQSIQISTASTLERLRSYIHNNIEGSLTTRDRTAVFIHDFRNLSPERQRIILEMRREHSHLLRGLIQKAKDEKLISKNVDVKVVSLAILTMTGSLYRWFDPTGVLSSQTIADQLTQFVIQGLGTA